ncbi:MAG: hypothetical protein CMK59_05070 [Proteobacteria bacterium]|nr:hypothetical protein [Pseudomonadota bacterium]
MKSSASKKTALSSWGRWFKENREQRNISRGTLAKALGYKNLSKGSRKIVSWERGEAFPNKEDSQRIIRAFNISMTEWVKAQDPVDDAYRIEDLLAQSRASVEDSTRKILIENHELLLGRADEILKSPNLSQIAIHGQNMGMMYVGGVVNMILGGLISMWREGKFQTQSHYLIKGGGSPLSGSQKFVGFKKTVPHEIDMLHSVYSPLASNLGPLMQHVRRLKKDHRYSVWSLSQYLAVIGVDVAPMNIYKNGEILGRYIPKKARLELTQASEWGVGAFEFPLLLGDINKNHKIEFTVSSIYGPPVKNGRVVVGDILTGQMGAWEGEVWIFKGKVGRWTLTPSQLLLDDEPLIYWECDLPPLVARQLIYLYEGLNASWVSDEDS